MQSNKEGVQLPKVSGMASGTNWGTPGVSKANPNKTYSYKDPMFIQK